MATVNWADESDKGNGRGGRGRRGRIDPSYYSPIIVEGNEKPWNVIPKNFVPKGKGGKDEQIGYWNEQPRWRMRKGEKVELPSKWHFYYLGTGPQSKLKFRERAQGVVWVAVNGAKTADTGLGTRKRNQQPIVPTFDVKIPSNITIVEDHDRSAPSSRSQSRGRSQSRNDNRSNNQSRNQSRNNSRSRSNSRGRSGNPTSPDDLVAAVRAALEGMGFEPIKNGQSGKNTPKSGNATPKKQKSRASSPAPRPASPKKQMDKPRWKRTPNQEEDVVKCFGPRDFDHNFGDSEIVRLGVEAPHYPQLAELVPSQAALLFDSNISTKELKDQVMITYTYSMLVPKDNKHLGPFLQQVNAFADGDKVPALPPKVKRQKSKTEKKDDVLDGLNIAAPAFEPKEQRESRPLKFSEVAKNAVDPLNELKVEMVDEVKYESSA
ncbi:N protein [NL63-related bat coronavirus]|uniref:Nucleoprotein n=1 Tax=NL63-related bat coronavirus TaxID=1920748 RepID=A0A1L2KGC8_9ALPC|nr:N protein [NL63-related bat coronavirus]APD51487.1 N protein [NL63-related bat coronavirus]